MKIGIDISQIVYKGGVATYTQNLVKSLLDIDKTNSYVLFGSSLRQRRKLVEFLDSLSQHTTNKLFSFPQTALNFFWNRLHIIAVERFTGPIDIFHSSDWTQPPAKAKKVTTIHDLAVYRYPEHMPKQIIDVHKRRLDWVAKECDVVIADSHNTKEDIMQYLKIPREKIHVVYLGIDSTFSLQNQDKISQLKQRYRIEGDYILTFGALGYRKNVKGLTEAFNKLKKEIPHSLVIIGKEQDMVVDNEDRIINLPLVPASDLPIFYSGASCFVYPSFYEGFGLPILEAMACGTVVVSSNRGSLEEIIIDSNFIVDPEDPVDIAQKIKIALELSKNERKERIMKGFAHTKQFTWKKTAEETLKVYRKVIQV